MNTHETLPVSGQKRLFNPRLLADYVQRFPFPVDLPERHTLLKRWIESLKSRALETTSEVSLHGEFLMSIFRQVLGYQSLTDAGGQQWELHPEKQVRPLGTPLRHPRAL